jgi:hypothetical protein
LNLEIKIVKVCRAAGVSSSSCSDHFDKLTRVQLFLAPP